MCFKKVWLTTLLEISLCLVDPTLEKQGGKNHFLRGLTTLSFHVIIPAKEQSVTMKYTCTLLYHNHTQLHMLPQGSWKRCQTEYGMMVACPVLTGKYTVKKIQLWCNCLEGDQQSGLLCQLLLLHSIYNLGNVRVNLLLTVTAIKALCFRLKFSSSTRIYWLPHQLELILET